jgi:hypothetical protein
MKILMLATLAVSSVAWAQAPKAPAMLCIDDQCAQTPEPVAGVKWHPGHYMQVLRGEPDTKQSARFAYYDEIGWNSKLQGVGVFFRWSQLEGARGDYSAGIALIRAEVAKLKSLAIPKRLAIRVMERAYSSPCPASAYFPAYVQTAGKTFTVGNTVQSCQWRRWDPEAMGWFIAMLEAYGRAFDGDPYVEIVSPMHETAIAWMGQTPLADFSESALDTQYRRLAVALKKSWPHTIVWMPTNWGLNGARMSAYVDYLHSIGVGVGNPDICPSCNMPVDSFTRGKTPHAMSVEVSELGYNSVGPAGGFTAQQIYDYAVGVQKVTHLFWDRNTIIGTTAQRWETGILPIINGLTLSVSLCPSLFTACVN